MYIICLEKASLIYCCEWPLPCRSFSGIILYTNQSGYWISSKKKLYSISFLNLKMVVEGTEIGFELYL